MELGNFEYAAMNNPLRRAIQKWLEFGTFQRHLKEEGIQLQGSKILDAGCGSAHDYHPLEDAYAPDLLVGFDFMAKQIRRGKERLGNGNLYVGDMTRMSLPDELFDAVFVFSVLHHIPDWREALKEINRVLAPGGVLLVEEPNKTIVDGLDYLGADHPLESRFGWDEFRAGLREAGYNVCRDSWVIVPGFRSFLCRKPQLG